MRLLRPLSVVLLVFSLIAGILPVQNARAQSGPQVSIDPMTVQVGLNDTAILNITISNVSALYAFDIMVKYDPTLVAVSQVNAGSFLDAGFLIVNEVNTQQGTVHFATTQLSPSTPKSGSGVLLSITLRGLQLGMGGLRIASAQLANIDGQFSAPTLKDGQVGVAKLPSATPTSTNSPTLTPTATFTPVPSVTPTPLPTSTNTRLPTATNTLLPSATPTLPQLSSTNTVLPSLTLTWTPTASLLPVTSQTLPGNTLNPMPPTSGGLISSSTPSVQPQDPSTTPLISQSVIPTMAGAGGLLTSEPIETGAPPTPIIQNEDPTFWIVLIALALLAVVLLAGILHNYQRKSPPH